VQGKTTTRSIEIDILRSMALIMMMIHHIVFDLWYVGLSTIHPFTGFMWYWQKATLSLFLLLVGITYSLYAPKYNWKKLVIKQIRRCITIGACALGITAVTMVFIPLQPIYFGVLHCIALSMLILPFMHNRWIATTMIMVIGISYTLAKNALPYTHNYFSPFHLYNSGFSSLDYVPLIPWLAAIIAGSIIGTYILPFIQQTVRTESRLQRVYLWPGRNTLFVYLVHQPVFIVIIWTILQLQK
jgi:uncharacterized membrane protein